MIYGNHIFCNTSLCDPDKGHMARVTYAVRCGHGPMILRLITANGCHQPQSPTQRSTLVTAVVTAVLTAVVTEAVTAVVDGGSDGNGDGAAGP